MNWLELGEDELLLRAWNNRRARHANGFSGKVCTYVKVDSLEVVKWSL